ncbi:MAG: hypothetical protein MI976_26145 [Pseudomonadales bacterium]|nr:hypothetical protein [Pseudomonadales bacterium]
MSENTEEVRDTELDKLKQGTYSDILFVLLPFLAIVLQRLWTGEVDKILMGHEVSTAAAILGGLSISKFIQGLVAHPDFGVKKDRVVFVIALTIFCVVVPSLIMTMKLVDTEDVPSIVAYIQPILIVIAVSLYISAIRIVKSFDKEAEKDQSNNAKNSASEANLISFLENEAKADGKD